MPATAESVFRAAVTDLDAIGARHALIGGLAVSARTEPRFTRDVDFAVAVTGDDEAVETVRQIRLRGWQPADGMGHVRLERDGADTIVDLMFASSGIEREIVTATTRVDVSGGIVVPVATTGHLIAMKALAGRDRDRLDLSNLIPAASAADLKQAREAVRLIKSRGFSRDKDLAAELEYYITEAGR